jgi:hypothetical protein
LYFFIFLSKASNCAGGAGIADDDFRVASKAIIKNNVISVTLLVVDITL